MAQPYHVLTTLDQLDAALERASREPILLFKHSETCGMSLQAHEELLATLQEPSWTMPVYFLSVLSARPVSTAIAQRLRVTHQSPQALLVEGGQVRWHTSHLAITVDALLQAAGRFAPTS